MAWPLRAASVALAALVVSTAAPAFAQPAPDEARRATARAAYLQGEAASEKGDFATAAKQFALADEIVPNPTALESAIQASLRSGDAVLGMELIERTKRDSALGALPVVAEARSTFGSRAGRIRAVCPTSCTLAVDGNSAKGSEAWVLVGPHKVTLTLGGNTIGKDVVVSGGATADVPWDQDGKPATKPPGGATDATPKSGVSIGRHPAWFFVGLGATAALGGVVAWSFVDLGNTHDEFIEGATAYVESRPGAPSYAQLEELASAGESAQTRSWALVGVTAALGVGTIAIAAFLVDWSGGSGTTTKVGFGPGSLTVGGTFH